MQVVGVAMLQLITGTVISRYPRYPSSRHGSIELKKHNILPNNDIHEMIAGERPPGPGQMNGGC